MRKRFATIAFGGFLAMSLLGTDASGEPLRDPTRPYKAVVAGVSKPSGYLVNAIIVSAERRVAIVNGQRVGVGGDIGDAKVLEINSDHLVLQKDGKRITAALRTPASP